MRRSAAKRVQAACAGQTQIEQDGVEGLCVEKPVSVFGGIGHRGGESQRLRYFAAGFADRSFVVDDQKV
jgi:hypothetical protein